jgi:hypothetical protein
MDCMVMKSPASSSRARTAGNKPQKCRTQQGAAFLKNRFAAAD